MSVTYLICVGAVIEAVAYEAVAYYGLLPYEIIASTGNCAYCLCVRVRDHTGDQSSNMMCGLDSGERLLHGLLI